MSLVQLATASTRWGQMRLRAAAALIMLMASGGWAASAPGAWPRSLLAGALSMLSLYLLFTLLEDPTARTTQSIPRAFDELSDADRHLALQLAWSAESDSPAEPTFQQPEHVMICGVALVFDVVCYALFAAIFGGEALSRGVFIAAYLGLCIASACAALAAQQLVYRRRLSVFDAAWNLHATSVRKAWLRSAAVGWVHDCYPEWRAQATQKAVVRAGQRFLIRLKEATRLSVYKERSPGVDGMPYQHVDIFVLLVGPFVAMRSPFELHVKETSFAVAKGEPLVTSEERAFEREFHYADIVTIEYEQARPTSADGDGNGEDGARGTLQLTLVNGEKAKFESSQLEAEAAVRAIRRRTRAEKTFTVVG
jgi:hypothetical protein